MPATPQANTKIERAVESIEALTNAVVTLREKADDERTKAMTDVLEARQECRDALADFLKPTLRVFEQAQEAA